MAYWIVLRCANKACSWSNNRRLSNPFPVALDTFTRRPMGVNSFTISLLSNGSGARSSCRPRRNHKPPVTSRCQASSAARAHPSTDQTGSGSNSSAEPIHSVGFLSLLNLLWPLAFSAVQNRQSTFATASISTPGFRSEDDIDEKVSDELSPPTFCHNYHVENERHESNRYPRSK